MNARFAVLIAALATSTGCATLMAPKTASIEVTSNVPGAQIRVNGQVQGHTPARVSFERDKAPQIEVAAPGFRPQSCHVSMSAKTTYVVADAALCLFLLPFGCISFIDAGGAWNEPNTDRCSVQLEPDYSSPWAGAHGAPPQQTPTQGQQAAQGQQVVTPPPPAVPPAYQPPPGYQLVPASVPAQPPPAYQPPPGYQLVPIK